MHGAGGALAPQEQAQIVGCGSSPRQMSLTEHLSAEKARLTSRIKEIDTVLEALKSVPEVEKVIDLVFKHVR